MKLPVVSYTFLRNWENCPRKAHHIHVLKDLPKQPDSELVAMKHGIAVHDAMEARLKKKKPLPETMQKWERFCDFGAHPIEVELKVAIRSDGSPCQFFDSDVWCRGKVDVAVFHDPALTCAIFDWKTGKKREDPAELELHAMMLQRRHPQYKTIVGHYVWLGDNEIGAQHDLSDGASVLASTQRQMAEIQKHADVGYWPPRENPLCGWCPVRSCEFNPKR